MAIDTPTDTQALSAIRVVLVDDHDVVRFGLRAVLETERDIEVVGEATNGKEAIAVVQRLDPDVVIMDLSMDGMDGMTATRALIDRRVRARVIVLTMHEEDGYLIPALEAGASGYLVKSTAARELVNAIRNVMTGEVPVRAAAAQVLARRWARKGAEEQAREMYEELSEREQAVFTLFAQGYTSTQIGERLHISPKTVDTYRRRIHEKSGIGERADYVKLALTLGLLRTPDAEDE
jgi:two-component system response regulator NreC